MNSKPVGRDSVEPKLDFWRKGALKYGEFAIIRIIKEAGNELEFAQAQPAIALSPRP